MGQKQSNTNRGKPTMEAIKQQQQQPAVQQVQQQQQIERKCCICHDDGVELCCNQECQHHFCVPCGQQWIQAEIDMFSTGEIRCPNHTSCGKKLDITQFRQLFVRDEDYFKLLERQYEFFITTNRNYHRCSRGCSFVYEYVHDLGYCQDSFKIGDRIFYYGRSYYTLIPGVITGCFHNSYMVQPTPRDANEPIEEPSSVDISRVAPLHKVLQYGMEVEYRTGPRSFFNNGRAYIISALRTDASGVTTYDLLPKSHSGKPEFGVGYESLSVARTKYLESEHNYHCLECHYVGCLKCGLQHSQNTTCEQFAERHQRDLQNITQMVKYRENHLQSLNNPSDAQILQLQETINLLNQLEIRVCKQCLNGVEKTSGCDKMMCRCGYKFCYHCGVENATCECTPSNHTYINNAAVSISHP